MLEGEKTNYVVQHVYLCIMIYNTPGGFQADMMILRSLGLVLIVWIT